MKKILVQFHAASEELIEYLNSVSAEFGLIMTVMIPRPFTLKEIDRELLINDLMTDGDIRIILTKEKPTTEVSSLNNFYDLNPDVVTLDIGLLTNHGLKESALSCMSDDKEKITIANKLASKLKKITQAGAIAINPTNGAEASIRSHRYTEGAKAIYNAGIKILPVAGNSFLKLI